MIGKIGLASCARMYNRKTTREKKVVVLFLRLQNAWMALAPAINGAAG